MVRTPFFKYPHGKTSQIGRSGDHDSHGTYLQREINFPRNNFHLFAGSILPGAILLKPDIL